ncbi:DNA-directed RNA polymerase subunit L [Archaeoglobales archaeon]|nr:MAG: DNA-directed RNA polymerase subunit L [Archaeoglobales archaeon]
MEIKITELDENYARIKIRGEDHTFLNLLQHFLLEVDGVLLAKYDVPHPLIDEAELIVRTDGLNPMDAIKRANEFIIRECDEILDILG